MNKVPRISIRYDPRFNLDENWNVVQEAIDEAQARGVLTAALTILNDEGKIIGWYLHGYVNPPAIISYSPETPEETKKRLEQEAADRPPLMEWPRL
jgi:hypothetical protein